MKKFLGFIAACLLTASLPNVSQAFHRLGAHGCTGAPACQGKTAACTGTQTTACKGAVMSCTGFGVVTVPRRTVVRTTVGCDGVATQTVRSRGVRYVVVPTVQPTPEAVPAPKKK